ncbi:ABC transporter permease, partial [Streptomyces sp. NRRL WC-3549]|uniref:ABC transporter permease n=1 Tax=Streptomyces sp. NRRL WC-3549 TaxID=1463925 RepID=UPI0004C6128C
MLYFAWHMMRRRIAALLAVMCATLGGAAMVTGIGVLAETGLRSHAPVERLSLADVVVSASQTYHPGDDLPISLPERARVPAGGRGGAVPAGDPGTNGHGWSSAALLAAPQIDGSAPRGAREVALDGRTAAAAGVRPGGEVTVSAWGRTAEYTVSAVVKTAGTGAGGVYFPDSVAESAAPGRADLIAVRARAGEADAVAAAVRAAVRKDGLTVTTGAARGDIESPGTAAAGSLLPALAGSLAGVTLLVVAFIVGGALSVSIASQRRELALMRAVGATPRQIRRLAAGQAVIITLAACVPGIGLGYLLAEQLRSLLVSVGMLPPGLPLTVGPLPAVAALLLLTGVVAAAAVCAAWRTSRMPATEAVAESRSEPRTPSALRTRAGAALIVVATGVSVMPLLDRTQAGAAGTAVAGLGAAVGLALAGPALVGWAGRALAGRLSAKTPAPTWLAVENSHGYALRGAAAVSTLAITVVFTLTYTLTQTTVQAATGADMREATRAQLALSAPELGGVPDDLPGALREVPGVESAAPVGETTVVWQYRMFGEPTTDSGSALVLTPEAAGVLDLDVRTGGLDRLTGDTVALGSETAASLDAETGDRVRLVLG